MNTDKENPKCVDCKYFAILQNCRFQCRRHAPKELVRASEPNEINWAIWPEVDGEKDCCGDFVHMNESN